MEISRLELLVVGVGSIGRRHSDVLYSSLGCHNITLYDPLVASAEAHAQGYPGMAVAKSYEDALAQKPDAVFITSPTALHMKQCLQALEAHCHVMVEKPLDISFENTSLVKAAAKKNDKMVSVAFSFRYHSGVLRAKKVIDSGILGKIISVRAKMSEYFPDSRPDYKNTYYVQYSGAFELIHAVDLALWAAGGQPEKIMGICGSYGDIGFTSPDTAEILFETDNAVVGNVSLSFCRTPGGSVLHVYGSEGSLELVFTNTSYTLKTYTRTSNKWETEASDTLYRNMMFEREDKEFLEDICSGKQRGCSIRDAERSLKVYCEVYGNSNPPPSGWE